MKETIVVSGGAGGIGRKIVSLFLDCGFVVVVLDKEASRLNVLKEKHKSDLLLFDIDVTNTQSLSDWREKFSDAFQINHIITLAGRALMEEWKPFELQSLQCFKDSIELNLLGHINVIHTCFDFFANDLSNKSILMISSINAMGAYGLPAYSSAKSGLYGFMNSTVSEFGKKGIRINTLSLGTVVTPNTLSEPKDFDKLLDGTALNRFVNAEDVAQISLQICTKYKTMTGQNIVLDSGQSKIRVF